MSVRKYSMALAVAAVAWPNAVLACIPFAPPPPLPGENETALRQRIDANAKAREDEERRAFQMALFDRASSVHLGSVRTSRAIEVGGMGGSPGHAIRIAPVAALKGVMGSGEVSLADERMTTCGLAGGGSATGAQPGSYVVLFTGVAFGNDPPRPFGITIADARDPRVLDAITAIAVRLRNAATPDKANP